MAPARIDVDENNHVRGVYVTPQMISKIKGGRASVRATGEPDIFVPCQTLIVAIGQDIEFQHFRGRPVFRSTAARSRPSATAVSTICLAYLQAATARPVRHP